MDNRSDNPAPKVPVRGLGDEAYFQLTDTDEDLLVRRGNNGIEIEIRPGPRASQAAERAAELKLAPAIATQVPRAPRGS